MNAEFLELNIEIYFLPEADGQRRYTAKPIRKNLAPSSFIGATVVTEDGLRAYFISSATLHYSSKGTASIRAQVGPYILVYYPATGTFATIWPGY